MKGKNRLSIMDRPGYTLVESMILVAIVGLFVVMSLPQLAETLESYRLQIATAQISSAVQLTRAKAVSENFNFTMTCSPSSGMDYFTVAGSEDDKGDGLQAWEDRNGNGITDQILFPDQYLPKGVRILFSPDSVATAVPVSGSPTETTSSLTFTPAGTPTFSAAAAVIYLKNMKGGEGAVSVDHAGRVQVWRWTGSEWRSR